MIIQIAQVIIAPIPGNVTSVLGGALFGIGLGFLLTTTGILIGSFLSFIIAKRFGKPIVLKFVSQEVFDRYNGFFKGRSVAIVLIIFLIPFFPKDAFCFIIGLSAIRLGPFMIAMTIGRMPGIIVASLTGAGLIDLPWEVWAIIAIPAVAAVYFSFRYGEQIENWLYNRFHHHVNSPNNSSNPTDKTERDSEEPLS